MLRELKTCLFDEKVKSKSGLRQFKTYKSPIFDEDGVLIGTVGVAQDVTDLKNMDTELQIILRSIPYAIVVSDERGRIIQVNQKFESVFRQKADEIIGLDYMVWKCAVLPQACVAGVNTAELSLCKDDEAKILELLEEPIVDIFDNAAGTICIFRDVTLERTLNQRILHNANTDYLTGLYNRRFFYEQMEMERDARQTNLLYMDIDNFKAINDTYGHQLGDEALVLVARFLVDAFPEALIARVGGDEFLLAILGEMSMENLEQRTQAFLKNLRAHFKASDKLNSLSLSVGIAVSHDHQVGIDDLIKESDIALYEAKRRGKSQYCVYNEALRQAE